MPGEPAVPGAEWSGWLDLVESQLHAGDDPVSRVLLGQIRDRVLHKAGLRRGDVLVDLGCGRGLVALEAARIVGPQGRVIGVDLSEGALERAREEARRRGLSNLQFIRGDVCALPLEDGIADAVTGRSVFAYIREREAALREALRVLKPGGRISLFEPVLREESYQMDWGEAEAAWRRMRLALERLHPAYGFGLGYLPEALERVGFVELETFVWHADTSRTYASLEEARLDLGELLPGDLAPSAVWREAGIGEDEVLMVTERLWRESARPGFRNSIPCVYAWGRKPG